MSSGRADRPVELTLRALLTGMLLGALLAPCNVYSGLKIGWSFNMSIAALLLGYMVWVPLSRLSAVRHWGIYESNISQTTASSAASIISGGLVAPLPALALMQGENLPWLELIAWVFAVSFLGVWIGWYLRGRLVVESKLAFPAGVATAETMRDIFGYGTAAASRVIALLGSLVAAITFNAIDKLVWALPRWAPTAGIKQYTFFLDPSLLLLGFGSIIGIRAGLGLLLGALVAWGLLAPALVARDIVVLDSGNAFQALVSWLLWPGIALMLTSSFVSIGMAMVRKQATADPDGAGRNRREAFIKAGGLLVASALVVALEIVLFDIDWMMAILAVPLAFLLATVAARVTGETGIPPIGAVGKLSQLSFAALAPFQPITNLMTANVAGGAAGQSADLLNDLKAGHEIGATPAMQIAAQCCGVLAGSIVGSLVYLALIDNPTEQLLTPEWPAPAVATWKAVAETLAGGIQLPEGVGLAILCAGFAGAVLALLEQRVNPLFLPLVPSGSALGLAFVVPASTSLTLFLGSGLGALGYWLVPGWSKRFLLSVAAGLVAGESLFGVAAVWL